jgi:hypothetical protein
MSAKRRVVMSARYGVLSREHHHNHSGDEERASRDGRCGVEVGYDEDSTGIPFESHRT